MTQEPQQPPAGPGQGGSVPPPGPPPAQQPAQPQWVPPHYEPSQWTPPQQPAQPQWGQYAPQPPQWGRPQQPGPNPYGYNQYAAPPKPGVIPLRPLRLGEVLDGAFQAARRNGKAVFGSTLIFQVLTAVLTLAVSLPFLNGMSTSIFADSLSQTAPTEAQLNNLAGSVLQFSIGTVGIAIITGLLEMVLQGALVVPVLRATLNHKTGFGQMWRLVRPRIGTLLLLALVYGVATILAVPVYMAVLIGILFATGSIGSSSGGLAAVGFGLLLVLPFLAAGVWAGVKVMLAPAAIVVENTGVFAGIKRSWQLTRQNWWRTFGIAALAAIIASAIGAIISTPVSLFMGLLLPVMAPGPDQLAGTTAIASIATSLIGALVGAVTVAFQTGVMALLYVDLRMRRDGFDVTLLKESESGKDDGGIPGRGAPVPAAAGSTQAAPYPHQPPPAYPPAWYPGQDGPSPHPGQIPPGQQPPSAYPPNGYPPNQQPGQ
ncbi:hypothetical protein [Arthrobacter sp. SDTb3-6]|uniref:DUF7847 domain-containing protein n=1 Tax=Arthrobacter sp. SDTb3-6 TaxID=2713571 RepID=UPI00159EA49C|nr:hypothetical protein [Arthrobacter sp. SDTb3-6]NVM97510.1 hypothetical protein [Arthrobacter sp. SDTb3-6]